MPPKSSANRDNRYPCSDALCPYKTRNPGRVNEHFRAGHETEKEFKCPHCTYSAATTHILNVHVKLHGIDSTSTEEGVKKKKNTVKTLKRPAARVVVSPAKKPTVEGDIVVKDSGDEATAPAVSSTTVAAFSVETSGDAATAPEVMKTAADTTDAAMAVEGDIVVKDTEDEATAPEVSSTTVAAVSVQTAGDAATAPEVMKTAADATDAAMAVEGDIVVQDTGDEETALEVSSTTVVAFSAQDMGDEVTAPEVMKTAADDAADAAMAREMDRAARLCRLKCDLAHKLELSKARKEAAEKNLNKQKNRYWKTTSDVSPFEHREYSGESSLFGWNDIGKKMKKMGIAVEPRSDETLSAASSSAVPSGFLARTVDLKKRSGKGVVEVVKSFERAPSPSLDEENEKET